MNRPRTFIQFPIVGQNNTTFARTEVLGRLKAKATEMPPTADPSVPPLCTVRLGTVFNYNEAVPFGNFQNSIHIGRDSLRYEPAEQLWSSVLSPPRFLMDQY